MCAPHCPAPVLTTLAMVCQLLPWVPAALADCWGPPNRRNNDGGTLPGQSVVADVCDEDINQVRYPKPRGE
jgi:hypothetical protein